MCQFVPDIQAGEGDGVDMVCILAVHCTTLLAAETKQACWLQRGGKHRAAVPTIST